MNKKDSNFWLSNKASKVFEIANAEQKTVQPLISKIIKQLNPKTFLDYGCGDSFISRLLNKDVEIGLFDINKEEASKAYRYLKDRNVKLFESYEDIPTNHYDCILFSLVLVCIDNKKEYQKILSNFKKYKKVNGRLIIVSTHPCFRQYDYRPFYTEYTLGKQFNYFKELEPFDVFIRGDENEEVSFTDYHWSMSETINEALSYGFNLERMIEVPDMSFDKKPFNKNFSPFVILIFK